MKSIRIFSLSALVFGLGAPLSAQTTFFQAPTGPGGTWNVYQLDFTGVSQKDAFAGAAARMEDHNGNGDLAGHLVTIASQMENDLIWRWGNRGNIWIGLSDREGVTPGAEESQTFAPDQKTMGWTWITGEPFDFQNWGDVEPNNAGGVEDGGHIGGDGRWNDNVSGYGVDDPIAPTMQIGTSGDE